MCAASAPGRYPVGLAVGTVVDVVVGVPGVGTVVGLEPGVPVGRGLVVDPLGVGTIDGAVDGPEEIGRAHV